MALPKRFFLYLGFGISVLSVALNTFVISAISDETADTRRNLTRAQERAVEMTNELAYADHKYDSYQILHHVARLATGQASDNAKSDAEGMLQEFMAMYYAAASGIPAVELYESQSKDSKPLIAALEKAVVLMDAMKTETDPVKKGQLAEELGAINFEIAPVSELGKKIEPYNKIATIETTVADHLEFSIKILPVVKDFQSKTLESIKAKKEEILKLEAKLDELSKKGNFATYFAVALQLLGLLLVVAESIVSDKQENSGQEATSDGTAG